MRAIIFITASFLVVGIASASTEATPTPPNTFQESLDSTHRILSHSLLYLPHTFDSFFASELSELESNQSSFRLTLDTIFREGGVIDFEQTLRAKLILPHSKNKLRFMLESTPEDEQGNQMEQANSAVENPSGEKQQSAVLEAILKQTKDWRLSSDIGVKLRTPIDPFVRVRGRKEWHVQLLHIRFTQTLFEFRSTGAGARSVLNLEHPLSKDRLLRFVTSGTWWDRYQQYNWNQHISLYRQLSNKQGLAYNLSINGIDKTGNQVDSYTFDIRLRQRIYKKWLFYEWIPAVHFPRSDNFKDDWSLTLRLEAFFGKKFTHE